MGTVRSWWRIDCVPACRGPVSALRGRFRKTDEPLYVRPVHQCVQAAEADLCDRWGT